VGKFVGKNSRAATILSAKIASVPARQTRNDFKGAGIHEWNCGDPGKPGERDYRATSLLRSKRKFVMLHNPRSLYSSLSVRVRLD
jgi:hypothetical protein